MRRRQSRWPMPARFLTLSNSTLLLLLLPFLAAGYRVAASTFQVPHHDVNHTHSGPAHSHGGVVQKLKALRRVKASEWEIRLQPLEDVLQTYRVRHRECVNSKKLPGKYIVVRMEDKDAGIGNQLPSVVSGFLLALLMERCLFVDFPFFNKYFEHELDFSWANHYERLLKFGHNATAPENIAQRIPYGYVSIADLWMFKDMKESFNADYGVEMWKDLDWSAALLQSNPNHQNFIEKYFPTREMFAPLAAFLFKIAPQYETKIREFRHKNFGLFTIGMQIRRRKCNEDEHELHCDLRPSVESYCAVARSIQLAHGLHDNDVRFFLAADETATYTQVINILGKDRVMFADNGIAPTGTAAGSAETAAQNPGTLESALVDMALMSRCDDLVMTVASSFGYVAAAWGGFAPVHMVYGTHLTSQNPYWYRAISSEPCYWQAKNMMKDLDAKAVNRFHSNPFWMQYTQCHNDW